MTRVTPLLRFLRALDADQRKAFAAAVGTTDGYLYQLAAAVAPNPRLRLAMLLVSESKKLSKKVMAAPLTFDDLLIGASDEDPDPGPGPDASRT